MKHEKTETKDSSARERKIRKVEKSVISVLLALVVAAVAFVAGWFGRWGALGEKKRNLLWAIDTAEENYYLEIDEEELYKNLFAAFDFDPYSTYYPKEEYETIAAEREGQNSDAGFSVWQESYLEVYVAEGSSAEKAGIGSGMRILKYGKTNERDKMTAVNKAEEYFDFLTTLDLNEKYFVLCGDSERESEAEVYEVTNEEKGAGISLTRKSDPMRVYQVVGNSPADKAKIVANNSDGDKNGLKRGMYILKSGKSAEELAPATSKGLFALVSSLKYDEKTETYEPFYMQCSFDKEDANAPVYEIVMQKKYMASYCTYRDKDVSYGFRTVEENKKEKTERVLTDDKLALDSDTAYVALTGFTGRAAEEFKECLTIMKENQRKNLILDLRGNGGGYMGVFTEIASYLLKDAGSGAQKVAYAEFRSGATVSYSASKSLYSNYFGEDSRVSILADEYTASASECLIGALVDYKTVAFSDIYLRENGSGTARTYGKGIMQTHYEDSSGNTLKLTSAKIFWPKSNKTIHGVGVTAKGDGAIAIPSALLPDANDSFLQTAIEKIQNKGNSPSVSV